MKKKQKEIFLVVILIILCSIASVKVYEKYFSVKNKEEITNKQAYKMIKKNDNLLIIDVRTEKEYAEGHVKGSILIPHDIIESKINLIPRNKTILIYCKAGVRSKKAFYILKANGFENIYNMFEGMDKWKYEVEKGKGAKLEEGKKVENKCNT